MKRMLCFLASFCLVFLCACSNVEEKLTAKTLSTGETFYYTDSYRISGFEKESGSFSFRLFGSCISMPLLNQSGVYQIYGLKDVNGEAYTVSRVSGNTVRIFRDGYIVEIEILPGESLAPFRLGGDVRVILNESDYVIFEPDDKEEGMIYTAKEYSFGVIKIGASKSGENPYQSSSSYSDLIKLTFELFDHHITVAADLSTEEIAELLPKKMILSVQAEKAGSPEEELTCSRMTDFSYDKISFLSVSKQNETAICTLWNTPYLDALDGQSNGETLGAYYQEHKSEKVNQLVPYTPETDAFVFYLGTAKAASGKLKLYYKLYQTVS